VGAAYQRLGTGGRRQRVGESCRRCIRATATRSTAASCANCCRGCWQLLRLAQRHRIALVIDAEEAERLELSLDLIDALMASGAAGHMRADLGRRGAGLSETRAGS
jgi:acetyl-CoA carboxylase beta subunit